jgi:hypothetical protein
MRDAGLVDRLGCPGAAATARYPVAEDAIERSVIPLP